MALSAITKAGTKDREAIRAAVAGDQVRPTWAARTILGSAWQFDANGDTSLVTISVQKLDTRLDVPGRHGLRRDDEAVVVQAAVDEL